MKFIVQKVKRAEVSLDGEVIRSIGKGIVIYCGIHRDDQMENIKKILIKLEKFIAYCENRYEQKNIDILLLSNFTIYGEQKGLKINFGKNMVKEEARTFFNRTYEMMVEHFKERNVQVGLYAEFLDIESVVEGPFNFIIEV